MNTADTILHLERKFVLPSETFIVNQINGAAAFRHGVFTVKQLNEISQVNASIYQPVNKASGINLKMISGQAVTYFRKIIAEIAPRVIHGHYITDAAYFHPFTKTVKIPKVCSCYGYDVTKFPKQFGVFAKWYYKRVFKEYDVFLAMSENMRENLLAIGCPAEKIKIHYHGVDTRKFDVARDYQIAKPAYKIITVGQIDLTKGHLIVLQALRKIRSSHPDIAIQYIVVGEGPLKKDMLQYIDKNGLQEMVTFKGFVKHGPELNNILQSADVFVHPCIMANGAIEGIPGAIVEAMASGFPVISTYHGGIPSVIKHNETGVLIPENDVDALAEKLIQLYEQDDLRTRLGMNAKVYAQSALDLKKQCESLAKLYTSLS